MKIYLFAKGNQSEFVVSFNLFLKKIELEIEASDSLKPTSAK